MPSIYDIMIEMNLDDKVTEGLKGIGESFEKLLSQLEQLHEGLSSTLLMGAGIGLALGLNKIAAAANDLSDSLAKLKVSGEDMEEAMTAAERATAKVPGTTTATNVELIRRLAPVMGGARQVEERLPELARADWWLRTQYGQAHGLEDIIRVGRARGLSGLALQNFVDEQLRVVQATGGVYQTSQLLQASRRGGIAGAGYSEEYLTGALPWMQMQLGAGREQVGAKTARLEEALVHLKKGGAIDPKAWETWAVPSVGGRGRGSELFARDPQQWAERLGDAITKKFQVTDPRQLRDIFTHLFTDQVTAQIMYQYATQGRNIQGFRERVGQAPGTSEQGVLDYLDINPKALTQVIEADIKEMWEKISTDIQPAYEKQLKFIHEHMKEANEKLKGVDSRYLQNAFEAGTALGGVLIALSAVSFSGTVLTYLLGGSAAPVVLAMGAMVLAFSMMSKSQWKEASEAMESFSRRFGTWLEGWLGLKSKAELLEEQKKDPDYGYRRTAHWMTDALSPWSPRAIERRSGYPWTSLQEPGIEPGWFSWGREPRRRGGWFTDVPLTTEAAPYYPSLGSNARAIMYPPAPAPPPPSFRDRWLDPPPRFGGNAATIMFPPSQPPATTQSMPSFTPSIPRSEHHTSANVILNVDGHTLASVLIPDILSQSESPMTDGVNPHLAMSDTSSNFNL